MKIEVKDLKINDIFTESGITIKVSEIIKRDFENGKEGYVVCGNAIKHNVKMYGKNAKFGLGTYHKRANTKINVKR